MGVAAHEGELDTTALAVGQRTQAALQQPRRGQPGSGIVLGAVRGVSTLGQLGNRHRGQALVPQQIDGAIARDRHHPGHRTAPRRFELSGTLPDADEHVLQGLFGQRLASENPDQAREQHGGDQLVQPLQSRLVVGGTALQQLLQLVVEGRGRRAGGVQRSACGFTSLRFTSPLRLEGGYGCRVESMKASRSPFIFFSEGGCTYIMCPAS